MVVLRNEPLSDDLTIGELTKYDSKANMLETFRLIGVGVAKSWDKSSLAAAMDVVFSKTPALFANILPKEERMLFAGLLDHRQDEYVSCPADKSSFLMLQRLHLVATYEDKDEWRLYMPDKIRERLKSMLDEDIKRYPELEEMHNILSQVTSKEEQQAKVMPIKGGKGMHELTLKVQLDGTPIYRTFKVIDRCSLFELNMLIQFCYDWHDMNPYIFEFKEEEFSIVNSQLPIDQKTTRLSAIGLRVGDTFQFKYDMPGDKWLHTLTVEHIEPYAGKEDDYEPECISGSGPDPGEGAGGNAWVRRNLPYILRNKKKYHPFRKDLVNDSFHLWWTVERHWWIENGTIRYDE